MPRIKFALALTLVAAALSLGATALVFWAGPAAPRRLPRRRASPAKRPAGACSPPRSRRALLARRGPGGRQARRRRGRRAGREARSLLGRLLIFVGLAEGIAIYGVIISILILNRLG